MAPLALIRDCVIAGRPGAPLQDESEETSSIEPMHGGPAVQPVPHIGRNAFFRGRCR